MFVGKEAYDEGVKENEEEGSDIKFNSNESDKTNDEYLKLSDDKITGEADKRKGNIFNMDTQHEIIEQCVKSDEVVIKTEINDHNIKRGIESCFNDFEVDSKGNKVCSLKQERPAATKLGLVENKEPAQVRENSVKRQIEKKKDSNEPKKDITTEDDINELAFNLKVVDMKLRTVCSEKQIVEDNNIKIVIVVKEFEKTLSQLVVEKARDEACWKILMGRLGRTGWRIFHQF